MKPIKDLGTWFCSIRLSMLLIMKFILNAISVVVIASTTEILNRFGLFSSASSFS